MSRSHKRKRRRRRAATVAPAADGAGTREGASGGQARGSNQRGARARGSGQRGGRAAAAGGRARRASARRPRGRPASERPPAPWGSFPLVELSVLAGIVMLVLGFIDEGRRALLLGTGLILASLGGLELSIREHFAGYRSHSTILAGFCALVVLGALFYLAPRSLEPEARFAIAAVVFAAAFWALARAFKRRAGVSVKVR